MFAWISFFMLGFFSLYAEKVGIIANWCVDELPAKFENVKNEWDVEVFGSIENIIRKVPSLTNVKRIIVFNAFYPEYEIHALPEAKLVLFVWEPEVHPANFYDPYHRVYTWDDSLVDGKKFFRFNYPYLMPMIPQVPLFEQKKLCTMVTGHWVAHRLDALRFFATKPEGDFEFYGNNVPSPFLTSSMYKGSIPGLHSGKEKISVLKNYRFCMCLENSICLKGYITEKIFGCFAAGCVPIYLGATNVEEYIPKDCFIDFRDFTSYEHLYQFIKNMPKSVYEEYIANIRKFLKSEEAQMFSPQYFNEIMKEAVVQEGY